jgi:hypothetical protein
VFHLEPGLGSGAAVFAGLNHHGRDPETAHGGVPHQERVLLRVSVRAELRNQEAPYSDLLLQGPAGCRTEGGGDPGRGVIPTGRPPAAMAASCAAESIPWASPEITGRPRPTRSSAMLAARSSACLDASREPTTDTPPEAPSRSPR